jgi:hypothetical protein
MCYSVESSAKTSLYSLVAILLLFYSNVPHFKWVAMVLVGWCGMQFAELLLWLTNPRKSCTMMNKVITVIFIPLILVLQVWGPLFGSFFVKPWSQCSKNRKLFIMFFAIISLLMMVIVNSLKREKNCAVVTDEGHLHWWPWLYSSSSANNKKYKLGYHYLWLLFTIFPLFMLWGISYKIIIAISIIPLFGFFYGFTTDSSASIWCYYTSYTAVVSIIIFALYKFKIYNILK